MDIEAIIEGCKKGDRKSQDALVRLFAPKLMAVCKRYCKDSEIAKDALQESFINILKYINSFKGIGSFEGWMRRIAVNCSFRFLKKVRPVHFQDNNDLVLEKNNLSPDVFSKMGKDEIMDLVKKLPHSQYLVFNMKIVEGYSHKEIGEILKITASTSRSYLTRARVNIIKLLKESSLVKMY